MGSAFPAEPDGWTSHAERRVLFALAFPDWVCHTVYPECGIECPHTVHDCGLLMEHRLTDNTIDTASSATLALRIILESYIHAAVIIGDPLPRMSLNDAAPEGWRTQAVTGAQKNVTFMARGLAASLIREGITRFAELPDLTAIGVHCHVVTDPNTGVSVRACVNHEYGRPLLVLDAAGMA